MITLLPGAASPTEPFALWDNALARAVLTASSGTAIANVTGPQTYDGWAPAAMPGTVTAVWAAPVNLDCLALAAHSLGGAGAALTVEYSTGPDTAWITLGSVAPADNSALALVFTAVTARRLRLTVSGAVAPFIGVAMAGARLIIPSSVTAPYVPIALARKIELQSSVSLGGHYLGARVARQGAGGAITLNPVERAWALGVAARWIDAYNAGLPFFWASSPQVYPGDLSYCWRADGARELHPVISNGGIYCDLALEVSAYA